jgi:DNA-binding NarL/FixJ family response regulator
MQTRIYLVEDNPFILEWLTAALEELTPARVIGSASTEAQACDWLTLHQNDWDMAVLDLWLAQGTGVQVIKCIAKTGTQKIVILTNYVTQEMRKYCLTLGADAFFDKSTEIEEFTRYVIRECPAQQAAPEPHTHL